MLLFYNKLYLKELETLGSELLQLKHSNELWKVLPGITNSIGNLTMHICGNLRHFIGSAIGNTGYIRDREKEFTGSGLTVDELLELIHITKDEVQKSIDGLAPGDLTKTYPLEIGGFKMDYSETLSFLLAHLTYHLGQINYCRRILTSEVNS